MINIKPNILRTKIFTGQISNNSEIRYTISDDKITKILGSQRIQAYPAKMCNSENLVQIEWKINNISTSESLVSKYMKTMNMRMALLVLKQKLIIRMLKLKKLLVKMMSKINY